MQALNLQQVWQHVMKAWWGSAKQQCGPAYRGVSHSPVSVCDALYVALYAGLQDGEAAVSLCTTSKGAKPALGLALMCSGAMPAAGEPSGCTGASCCCTATGCWPLLAAGKPSLVAKPSLSCTGADLRFARLLLALSCFQMSSTDFFGMLLSQSTPVSAAASHPSALDDSQAPKTREIRLYKL